LFVRQYYYGSVIESIKHQAALSAAFYNKYVPSYSLKEKAQYIFENEAKEPFPYFEIIDWQHHVQLNSYGFTMEREMDTPDVKAAFKGEAGLWLGKNDETGERVIAVSNPLKTNGRIVGVLRYTVSIERIDHIVQEITLIAILIGLLVIAFSLALSYMLANRLVNPIKALTSVARQMAMGNFSIKAVKYHEDEIGTLAQTMNYMAKEIVKAEELKNDFISSISHELRTPLTSIKGWGETILSGNLKDYEETMVGLNIIKKETERLAGLVEDLLDFSKLQSGKVKLSMEKFNLNRIVEETEQQFRYGSRNKQIKLIVNIKNDPLEIVGDRNRMKQVLVNLVDNAYKFTPADGCVEIITQKTEREIWLEVIDNGMGIASENLAKVTEKFYKGDSGQSGSGLGLAICKELIHLHHGEMCIQSERGKGTKVKVRFLC
jgi:signal transduction histidine kinase